MALERKLLLYSRSECCLCDQAEALVMQVIAGTEWQLEKVDIDSDPALSKKYAWVIPVLARADTGLDDKLDSCVDSCVDSGVDRELNWPFPLSRVREFVSLS